MVYYIVFAVAAAESYLPPPSPGYVNTAVYYIVFAAAAAESYLPPTIRGVCQFSLNFIQSPRFNKIILSIRSPFFFFFYIYFLLFVTSQFVYTLHLLSFRREILEIL